MSDEFKIERAGSNLPEAPRRPHSGSCQRLNHHQRHKEDKQSLVDRLRPDTRRHVRREAVGYRRPVGCWWKHGESKRDRWVWICDINAMVFSHQLFLLRPPRDVSGSETWFWWNVQWSDELKADCFSVTVCPASVLCFCLLSVFVSQWSCLDSLSPAFCLSQSGCWIIGLVWLLLSWSWRVRYFYSVTINTWDWNKTVNFTGNVRMINQPEHLLLHHVT